MATVLQINDEGNETEAHQIKYLPSGADVNHPESFEFFECQMY